MWYFLISLSNGQPNEMTYPKADSASQNRGTKRTGAKQLPRQTHGLIWSLCPEHHGCLAQMLQMPFKSVQHEGHRSITQLQTFVSNQSAPQLPDDAPPPLPDVIGHMGEVVLCESVGCWLCVILVVTDYLLKMQAVQKIIWKPRYNKGRTFEVCTTSRV